MSELKSGLWYRCREFVTEQSAGEWDDKTIADDADKLMKFVTKETSSIRDALSDTLMLLKAFTRETDEVAMAVRDNAEAAIAASAGR